MSPGRIGRPAASADVHVLGRSSFELRSNTAPDPARLRIGELLLIGFNGTQVAGNEEIRRLVCDVKTSHPGAARGGTKQGGQDADGGRLARPIGTQKGVDLTLVHLEVDAVHRANTAREDSFQAPCLDRRHRRENRAV